MRFHFIFQLFFKLRFSLQKVWKRFSAQQKETATNVAASYNCLFLVI